MPHPSSLSIRRFSLRQQTATSWQAAVFFASIMWLLSRLVVFFVIRWLAPQLPLPEGGTAPAPGWDVFAQWDGTFYVLIATQGYEYANDGKGHLVAFFPLLPLLMRSGMVLGLSPAAAGTLVNNLAFWGALVLLYRWMEERFNCQVARWVTAVLAWCPFSLFGSMVYTEGLFLLFSTAALRAFEQERYGWTALWGAIATAARPNGIALVPALLLTTIKDRRPAIAGVASLAAAGGIGLFVLYCGLRFGDPLAFAQAQRGWRPNPGFDWGGWLKILTQISTGPIDWQTGMLKNPLQLVLFLGVLAGLGALWWFRRHLAPPGLAGGVFLLVVLWWAIAGDPLLNALMVFGTGGLLWSLRAELGPLVPTYGFCSLALILASGSTISVGRIAYGCVAFAIVLGMLLSRYPRWGLGTIAWFAILLTSFSLRFAQVLWAG